MCPTTTKQGALTAERLREVMTYGPETGEFCWRTNRPRVKPGQVVAPTGNRVTIDGRVYFKARLAWLYQTGNWPASRVMRRNRNSEDHRWENLAN